MRNKFGAIFPHDSAGPPGLLRSASPSDKRLLTCRVTNQSSEKNPSRYHTYCSPQPTGLTLILSPWYSITKYEFKIRGRWVSSVKCQDGCFLESDDVYLFRQVPVTLRTPLHWWKVRMNFQYWCNSSQDVSLRKTLLRVNLRSWVTWGTAVRSE